MSADGMNVCKRCFSKMPNSPYGKVSEEEYLSEINSWQTLFEYFDIGTDSDGMFVVNYRCVCRNCGFEYTFKYSENIY